jgi:multisubunit Na+/H+ antiporter MnhF subunit
MELEGVRHAIVVAGLVVLGVSFLLASWRAVVGPSLFDRVMALDLVALDFLGSVLLVSLLLESGVFMDVVLVVALLGFLGTMAFAAYLEGTLLD